MIELDPLRTALVGVHWQGEVVHPGTVFGPVFAENIARRGVVAKAAEVAAAMRAAGGTVVHLRVAYRTGYPDLVANTPGFALVAKRGAYIEGKPETRIIDELAPQPADIIITSRRLGGFAGVGQLRPGA